MKSIKVLAPMILFIISLLSMTPTQPAGAQTAGAPNCLHYVYLPVTISSGNNFQNVSPMTEHEVVTSTNSIETMTTKPASDQPDFNGDGCADLAVGAPQETLDSGGNQGMIHILYGSTRGVTAEYSQVWHREGGYEVDGTYLGDIQGEFRANEHFGETLATGDFNNDGYTDLAIGIQYANSAARPNSGAVQIIYGSEMGLVAANNQIWTQGGGWIDSEGNGQGTYFGDIYGGPEDDNRFGSSLTVGDFNGDDYADLAIGVRNEDIGSIQGAGAVNVIYGSSNGLTWENNQFLSQNELRDENNGANAYTYIGDLVAGAEKDDFFGHALAAGDLNNDSYDDLVIGVYGEGIGSLGNAGAFHIVRGSEDGLTAYNNEHWHQQAAYRDTNSDGSVDITIGNPDGTEESGDWFGYSLAVGDFNGDQFDDLAVGVPNESLWIDGIEYINVGVTQVFYSSSDGLRLTNEQFWQQDGEYALGHMSGSKAENYDKFGTILTTGDINGDGFSELIVGTPKEGFAEIGGNVGSVNVIYGTVNGLDLPNHQWLYQDLVMEEGSVLGELVGEASFNTYFGQSITTADINNDGYEELVVGVPGFKLDGTNDEVGAINIVKGTRDGLVISDNQLWHQDGGWDENGRFLGDLYDTAEDNDAFGKGSP